jgi:hypothetical protein
MNGVDDDDDDDDALAPVLDAFDAGRPPPLRWVWRWGGDPATGAARDPLSAAWFASTSPDHLIATLVKLRPVMSGMRHPLFVLSCSADMFRICRWRVCGWAGRGSLRCVGTVVDIDESRCDRCVRLIRAVVGDHAPPTMRELLSALASAKGSA